MPKSNAKLLLLPGFGIRCLRRRRQKPHYRKCQHSDRHCSNHAARCQRNDRRGQTCDELRIGNRQIESRLRQKKFWRNERDQCAYRRVTQPVLHPFRQRKVVAEHQETRAHQDGDDRESDYHEPDFDVAQVVPPASLLRRSSMISVAIAAAIPATTATSNPSFKGRPAAATAITPAVTAPTSAGLPTINGNVIAISARIAVN